MQKAFKKKGGKKKKSLPGEVTEQIFAFSWELFRVLWVRGFPADDPRGVTSAGTRGGPAQRVGVGDVGGTAEICRRELRFGHKASKKRSSQGEEGATPSRSPLAAGRGHPRGGRDVPVGSQAQGLRLRSVIPWVSVVGTGCPVRSSSRSPFGAETSSFWLSSLPLPLCHQLFPQIRPRLHPLLAVLRTKSALLGGGEKHFWKGIFFLLWGCAPGFQQNLVRPIRGAAPAADGQPAPCGGQARLATIPEAK